MQLINRYGSKLVSILIPTRKRHQRLVENLRQLELVTGDLSSIEVVIFADSDDTDTITALQNLVTPLTCILLVHDRMPRAYQDIHLMYSLMVERASGDLLFIFNDDSRITTPKWETLLEPYRNVPCVIHAGTTGESEFPIVHRSFPYSTNNFGLHCSIDRWFHMVAEQLHANIYLPELHIDHIRTGEPSEHDKDGYPSWNPLAVYGLREHAIQDAIKIQRDQTRPLVSFLIPTRKRPYGADGALKSIYSTAVQPDRIETLFRIDDDDTETLRWMETVKDTYPNVRFLVGPRLEGGYRSLDKYYTELFEQSTGEFVFIFNDDTVMGNQDWDDVLAKWKGKNIVLDPRWNHYSVLTTFPIVARKIPEKLGFFTKHIYIDQWFHYLSVYANCYVSARADDNLIFVDHLREHEPVEKWVHHTEPFIPEEINKEYLQQLAIQLRT